MFIKSPQYIVNKRGEKVSVVFSIKDYERIIEILEEIEDIRLYDEVKSSPQEYLSAEDVFRSIENSRNKKCNTK